MKRKYYEVYGYYEPSLYRINTVGTESINNYKSWKNEEQACTFLHEFIHFLQDITTVKGLENIYVSGEILRYATIIAKNSSDAVIHLPLDITNDGYNIEQNCTLQSTVFGDAETDVRSLISYSINLKTKIKDENTNKEIELYIVELTCSDPYGNNVIIPFGTIQIEECMANTIEEFVYPEQAGMSPYNPYYIGKDLANMIIPGIKDYPLTMIALYDKALQSSNPGLAFVNYLLFLKNQGYTCSTIDPDTIYNHLLNSITESSTLGKCTLSKGYYQILSYAKGVINELVGNVWFLGNIKNWGIKTLDKGAFIRLNYPKLFIDLAKSGKIQNNTILDNIIELIGTPLVTNESGEYNFIKPKDVIISKSEFVDVYSMMQLSYVFSCDGVYECPIKWYCQTKKLRWLLGPKLDEKCNTQPWNKPRFRRCKFIQWWRFKGFLRYKVIHH